MPDLDLFGAETSPPVKPAKTSRKSWPGRYGYPAPPGTGPEGKTCRDCMSCVPTPTATVHYKCAKNRARWGCTNLTDIKVRTAACGLFEQRGEA